MTDNALVHKHFVPNLSSIKLIVPVAALNTKAGAHFGSPRLSF